MTDADGVHLRPLPPERYREFSRLGEGSMGVVFLALYPDDPGSEFNASFFEKAPNALTDLLPDAADLEELVTLIDVPAAASGANAHVVADSESRTAVCFLE